MGRGADLREAPALDGRKALAQRVNLHDVRAAGQHLPGEILQIRSRDERLFKQGRPAARQQKQHGVVGGEIPHEG